MTASTLPPRPFLPRFVDMPIANLAFARRMTRMQKSKCGLSVKQSSRRLKWLRRLAALVVVPLVLAHLAPRKR